MMKHHHLEVAVVDRSEIMMPAAVVMVEEGMREDLSSDSRSLRTYKNNNSQSGKEGKKQRGKVSQLVSL